MLSIEQEVTKLLERYPVMRQSYNSLVLGYWIKVDQFPTILKDFAKTTPLESIVREARKVFSRRPELSPIANTAPYEDLFKAIAEIFPGMIQE